MTKKEWHVRLLMESSAIEQAKEQAKEERRSPAHYVAAVIEEKLKKEKTDDA